MSHTLALPGGSLLNAKPGSVLGATQHYVLEWKDNLLSYGASSGKWFARRCERRKELAAARVVVESRVLAASLHANGIPLDRLIVAPNAVDFAQFSEVADAGVLRHRIGIDTATVLIGYLGSFAFYHDTEILVRAVAQLQGALKHCKVVLIGAGKEKAQCIAVAAELGLDNRHLEFLEPVAQDDVPALLAELDIGVLPGSTDIICPIKIQEYMAAGLAVVAPDYPCNREVIKSAENGMLFRPGNVSALATVLGELIDNADMRRQVGARARLAAREHYTWEATWGCAMSDTLAACVPAGSMRAA